MGENSYLKAEFCMGGTLILVKQIWIHFEILQRPQSNVISLLIQSINNRDKEWTASQPASQPHT
jgi:hypothetical protein